MTTKNILTALMIVLAGIYFTSCDPLLCATERGDTKTAASSFLAISILLGRLLFYNI